MKYWSRRSFLVLLLIIIGFGIIRGQHTFNFSSENQKSIRVGFYNLENFFDLQDDSLVNDEEFLPTGLKAWDRQKYQQKLNNTFQVLAGLGGWKPPAIIGLCELENGFILHEITQNTPLKEFDYNYIHFDSPDRRGIDVGLIYRPSHFKPFKQESLTISFPDSTYKTRDILHVQGIIFKKDTLHLFINHWPSRWGGQVTSAPKRNHIAGFLENKLDSISNINPSAKIVIMGDFNDEPHNKSIAEILQNKSDRSGQHKRLVNLMDNPNMQGTLKYQGQWQLFDQIIVSENLVNKKNNVHIAGKKASIYKPDWLLREDEQFLGMRPFRTYRGYIYEGGFSDHLPVYIDLISVKK